MNAKPRYAVRADDWSYYVYDVKTDKNIKAFKHNGKDLSRGDAMRQATAWRHDLNGAVMVRPNGTPDGKVAGRNGTRLDRDPGSQ